MARRPSRPIYRNSIGKMIESLSFLSSVDTMLMEGVPASDVAKYIQEEMGELKDQDSKALANALRARKRQKEEVARALSGQLGAEADDEGVEAEVEETPKHEKPGLLVKTLYARTKGGIRDLLELEAMYLTQRDRIDRMVETEARQGIFAKDVGQEIIFAKELILARVKTKKDLGIDDKSDTPELDIRKYSEQTVGVLSSPESRHRVLNLLERLAKSGKLKVEAEPEEQIALPPPPSSDE